MYAIRSYYEATLVEQALLMALGRQRPTDEVLLHSDQGSQYVTPAAYTDTITVTVNY